MEEKTSHVTQHIPVLEDRIVELLAPALQAPNAIYLDCTLGLAGHALAVLSACPQARLIGLDRDTEALEIAKQRLSPVRDRCEFAHCRYDQLSEVLQDLGGLKVNAVLMDLGLSSLQIDRRERGFAYSVDAPLDMRMDATEDLDAATVVNTYSQPELFRLISRFGEERFASRIAKAIVKEREQIPFTTSARLVQVIADAIPMAARHTGGHPAKRTFQALRIEVNSELQALKTAFPAALDQLVLGGRVAVLAYHSLEDRLIKQELVARSQTTAPPGLPIIPEGMGPEFQLLTKGAERPQSSEVETNPRAASAKLRAAERIKEAA